MTEYSRMARGTFTSAGTAHAVYLPFAPDFVEMINYTAAATPANNGIPKASWDAGMGQGFAIVDLFNATPVLITDSVDTQGITTFNAGLSLQFGAQIQISGITKADPAVVTTGSAHGYTTGDVVIFEGLDQSSTTGMAQICGMSFVATVTGTTTFTIDWDTNQSNYTALSASPTGAFVKKVTYPFLYAPGVSYITAVATGTTTTVTTTAPHNLVAGQEVAFRIPTAYSIIELNSYPNTTIPGSPIYGFVNSVSSTTQVVVSINSAAFTAYTNNVAFASVPGLDFPQMIAVGDVNTGGVAYSGGALYPPPSVNGVNTINGPAISGAFVNNTRRGFIIGAGAAAGDASSVLVGSTSDVIYWRAFLHDINVT